MGWIDALKEHVVGLDTSHILYFLTNDKKLTIVKELKVLVLDDLKLEELA